MMNKKGLSNQIMVVIVMGMIIGLIIVFSYAGMLFFPLVSDSFSTLGGIMSDVSQETGNPAIQNATSSSFTPAVEGVQQLEWISFTIFVFLIMTMLIMCFYVRTYPFLVFIWILIIVVLVFFSIFLANAYQDLRVGSLGDVYTSWENTDYYLQWLPHIVMVIGIIGGIIMFVLASRQPEAEGVYI